MKLTKKQKVVLEWLTNDGVIFASNNGCFSQTKQGIPIKVIENLEDKDLALFYGIGGTNNGRDFTAYWVPTSLASH
ncbi:hypothetical protein LCGC14_2651030 [marine sediment metagenome]|uniref:Uncharacterized protein n=1 Tax=marine sediment metagenome TaxID=412755 RepID=A0A0F9AH32_9ZZZZ